jgi:bacteriocin-like protein
MEISYQLTELSIEELSEINGGTFPMLLIRLFVPSIESLIALQEGFRVGYERTTRP